MPAQEINISTLRQLIYNSFNMTNLRIELCAELGSPWDDLIRDSGKEETIFEIVSHAQRHGELPSLIERCQEVRPHIQWHECVTSHPQKLPFTNRNDERDKLTSTSLTTKYSIVHAPPGYGKSTLLKQVFGKYIDKEWACGYSQISGNYTTQQEVHNAIRNIVDQLSTTLSIAPTNNENIGRSLASAIERKFRENLPLGKGLALIIDLNKISPQNLVSLNSNNDPDNSETFSESILQHLLGKNGFVSSFMERLDTIPSRETRRLKVHIIIAGQSLARIIRDNQLVLLKFNSDDFIKLSPFKFEDIQRTARDYINGSSTERIDLVAAIALNKGVGHPDCIAEIIEYFERTREIHDDLIINLTQPERRQQFDSLRRLQKTASDVFDYLHKVIGDPKTLYLISLFRYLDDSILSEILKTCPTTVETISDSIDLKDNLVKTHLFHTDSTEELITDSIIRKLIVLHCNNPQFNGEYSTYCTEAKRICKANISNLEARPQYWASEYLYQHLQECIVNDPDIDSRENLRTQFREGVLPNTINEFLKHPLVSKDTKTKIDWLDRLINFISNSEQWELQFLCNYYHRTDRYYCEGKNTPFNNLIQEINSIKETIAQNTNHD